MNRLTSITKQIAALQKVAQLRNTQLMGLGGGGAFASTLQSILNGSPATYSGVEAQLMLGNSFMGAMNGDKAGQAAGDLAGLTDASMLIDSLAEFDRGKDGGGDFQGSFPGILGGAGALATMLETLRNVQHHPQQAAGSAVQAAQSQADFSDVTGVKGAVQAGSESGANVHETPGTTMAEAAGHTPTVPVAEQAARDALENKAYGTGEAARLAGLLAARFESNGNPGVIGYDRVGGTSYGMYQISSRAGTFDEFLTFLDARAPEWSQTLRAAGTANTGSKGGAVPKAWQQIASAEPDRFADVQHEFIMNTHFLPAAQKVAELTGIDIAGKGGVLAQVLWSTAVQHGASGSARIFASAVDAVKTKSPDNEGQALIEEVYKHRRDKFGSSTPAVQAAVQSRFDSEMELALNMLGGDESLFGSMA